jgi:hypothetical protein
MICVFSLSKEKALRSLRSLRFNSFFIPADPEIFNFLSNKKAGNQAARPLMPRSWHFADIWADKPPSALIHNSLLS